MATMAGLRGGFLVVKPAVPEFGKVRYKQVQTERESRHSR